MQPEQIPPKRQRQRKRRTSRNQRRRRKRLNRNIDMYDGGTLVAVCCPHCNTRFGLFCLLDSTKGVNGIWMTDDGRRDGDMSGLPKQPMVGNIKDIANEDHFEATCRKCSANIRGRQNQLRALVNMARRRSAGSINFREAPIAIPTKNLGHRQKVIEQRGLAAVDEAVRLARKPDPGPSRDW